MKSSRRDEMMTGLYDSSLCRNVSPAFSGRIGISQAASSHLEGVYRLGAKGVP
jgi:hypothetical protein